MTKRKRREYKASPVAENLVHTWVGETQFNRGINYVNQGLIKHTHRRGYQVSALCEGKRHGPNIYRVRSIVAEGKIEEAFCTCSIGKYGVCPHIAAMLILYSRQPELFRVTTWWGWIRGCWG